MIGDDRGGRKHADDDAGSKRVHLNFLSRTGSGRRTIQGGAHLQGAAAGRLAAQPALAEDGEGAQRAPEAAAKGVETFDARGRDQRACLPNQGATRPTPMLTAISNAIRSTPAGQVVAADGVPVFMPVDR